MWVAHHAVLLEGVTWPIVSKHVALFWLSDEKFSWVKEFKGDKHKALCCVCNKVIDIERMGESAFMSHMKGEKHKRNTGATSSSTHVMSAFFHKPVRSESNSCHAEGSNGECSVPPPLPEADGQSTVQLTEECLNYLKVVDDLVECLRNEKEDGEIGDFWFCE